MYTVFTWAVKCNDDDIARRTGARDSNTNSRRSRRRGHVDERASASEKKQKKKRRRTRLGLGSQSPQRAMHHASGCGLDGSEWSTHSAASHAPQPSGVTVNSVSQMSAITEATMSASDTIESARASPDDAGSSNVTKIRSRSLSTRSLIEIMPDSRTASESSE